MDLTVDFCAISEMESVEFVVKKLINTSGKTT